MSKVKTRPFVKQLVLSLVLNVILAFGWNRCHREWHRRCFGKLQWWERRPWEEVEGKRKSTRKG
jgi:hypothetical protein